MEGEETKLDREKKTGQNFLCVSSRSSFNSDSDDSGYLPSPDNLEEKTIVVNEEALDSSYSNVSQAFHSKRSLTDFRRFSTICSPGLEYSDIVSIPEVVVTSHDDDSTSMSSLSSSQHNVSDRRRRLRRSLSSPENLMISNMSLQQQKNDDFSVTLEDVEKFKVLRKRSGCGSSINSDESSSQTSETEVLELNKEADSDCTEKSKVSRTSSWKRVRPVIHLIPFVQLFKEKKYPWMQLAGHPGNFIKGEIQGTVLKKFNAAEERCYKQLMRDPLCQVVPQFYGVTRAVANPEEDQPQHYLELQCLLTDFHNPNICDTKLGVRTFLETEVNVTKPRHDLYLKMIKEDCEAPNEQEKTEECITKYRYLDWRDCAASSRLLGFRIEGLTVDGKCCRNYKTTREYHEAKNILTKFATDLHIRGQYLERLKLIKSLCLKSSFFSSHEFIGSSLLFVHDDIKASIWMIDFEKTRPVPGNRTVRHSLPWEINNHEDGYLIGLDNLISMFEIE